ncbi:ubiquitin carboxyl-terminal hydrolase [Microdochium bolleyi]|uniref:Ubiquitin carboxyl-terminal hydrolase n=1 Tax=Microdochium bolleyi TaxID=196109 RepID=A0A136JCZ0_9PEZI|nr:ubiquitin carboxyl-terminal hydrolase [Microdochium bolleyi]
MSCPHLESTTLRLPTPSQSVYREDCTQCFDSIDEPSGLDVCLQCFNGGCTGVRTHSQLHHITRSHSLALNIRRTRKHIVKDEPPAKMTKLAIAAETEADRYDYHTSVKCLDCATELDQTSPKLAPIVEGILKANTFSRQEEVKAWEQELESCEHVLLLQQHEARQLQSDLGHCSKCDLKENLWLCLECGNLGCGRAQFGGVGGNSHGLAHATESTHAVAVKLGSITPEGTADVYCYQCDEERVDENLASHLAHWGIILSEQVKTEKSLTEMQIEQNLRWEFSMTTDDGKVLQPVFGPGLTGLKNLGNSCYLASILQCLFDLPAFQERYNIPEIDLPLVEDPAQDLETQLRKVGDGLLSGRYAKPDSDVVASEDNPEIPHQRGLAPAMLKHLIGRGHAEFSTMRQQDAFELLQHLIKLITRSQHPANLSDPTQAFRFVLEQRLQCLGCKKVRYSTVEQDSIFIDVPLEKLPAEEGEGEAYKPVTLKQCLDNFTGQEVVELACAGCGSKDGFTKRSLFKTFPTTLVVNARKMAIENWVPRKVDVPVIVGDDPFPLDEYFSAGQQEGEELLPEDDSAASAPAFVANETALDGLMAMGFPRNRCEKALHATGNADANAAMEWLFGHMEDPDIDEPLKLDATSGSGSKPPNDSPEKIEMLTSMGFSVPQARKALKETSGDVERAVEWVFSHPDDQGDFDDGSAASGEATSKEVASPAGNADLPANFQLRSIVCHKGASIHTGHYVAFIRKILDVPDPRWVLFNDEKVVEAGDVEEMKKTAYVYFFQRV